MTGDPVDLVLSYPPCAGRRDYRINPMSDLCSAVQVDEDLAGVNLDIGAALAVEDIQGIRPTDRPLRLMPAMRAGDRNLKSIDHFALSFYCAAYRGGTVLAPFVSHTRFRVLRVSRTKLAHTRPEGIRKNQENFR